MTAKTRIPLQSATKDELIEAIKSELPFGNHIDRIEMHIYYSRCQSLIESMRQATDEMDRNRQSGLFNEHKRQRWNSAMRKWNKANAALEKLQAAEP